MKQVEIIWIIWMFNVISELLYPFKSREQRNRRVNLISLETLWKKSARNKIGKNIYVLLLFF